MAKIKTKARALDMLGRQQIAGIPTALSELFKNAHDAYADNVEVDYIRKKNMLILRDDGLGMTKDEFEKRWLTIGTDSKFEDRDSLEQPTIDVSKKRRQIMGEKGIGRLSIAAIGSQVLVLTRAKRENEEHKLVAAFINWTLFTLPALDLDDIEIPMLEVDYDKTLTKKQFDSLLLEAEENVRSLKNKISSDKIESICTQITSFDFDPEFWSGALNQMDQEVDSEINQAIKNKDLKENNILKKTRNLSLTHDGYGTHFIIFPVDEILGEEVEMVDTKVKTDQASRLEKALLGFTNTMYSDSNPPIIARFRDHTLEGERINRIGESIFFSPKEFESADHHFDGVFNEYGQFYGNIKVYSEEKKQHVIPWLDGKNKETICGAFKIKLAYVQGSLRDTKIAPELWKELSDKTNRYGGLYIYRDGIRVLPYGDSDFDFLRIEQRRSKSASQYFFSYRRMFGAIELTKEMNNTLQEKAGREGFIENKAYKQFKAILENFFLQVAADFFNGSGDLSELFIEQRKNQQLDYELLQKRANLKSNKKKKLESKLKTFFTNLDNDIWNLGIKKIDLNLNHTFLNFSENEDSIDDLVFEVTQYLNVNLAPLIMKLDVNRPTGMGFNKTTSDLWDQYQVEKLKINILIDQFKDKIGKKLVEYEDKFGDRTGLRRRFSDSLDIQNEYQKKQLNQIYAKAENALEELQKWAKSEITESKKIAKDNLDKVKYDFGSVSFANKNTDELFEIKKSLETRINDSSQMIIQKIEKLAEQIKVTQEGTEENAVSSAALTEVLESEYEHLKEQNEKNSEMVQLGMALGVVHHEFNGNIRAIRNGLKEMQPWANQNEKLGLIYQKIRTGFDHLDGYLKTFTPLTRRLARKKVQITGQALSEFIKDVFQERIEKENIEVNFTNEFLNTHIDGLTSTIYPAFVNLIDNSIYWLSKSSGEKLLSFKACKNGFIIKDSGPGIPNIDRENVFEFGFSRKVGGQGMGLYVTRQTLDKDDFEIALEDYKPDEGACFSITAKETKAIEITGEME